jgi:hypothetical protein
LHFVPEARMVDNVRGEVVLYAQDATVIRGNWRFELDPSAALGRKLRNPNLGAGKLAAPLSAPADYVEFQFHAEAGDDSHFRPQASDSRCSTAAPPSSSFPRPRS